MTTLPQSGDPNDPKLPHDLRLEIWRRALEEAGFATNLSLMPPASILVRRRERRRGAGSAEVQVFSSGALCLLPDSDKTSEQRSYAVPLSGKDDRMVERIVAAVKAILLSYSLQV